MGKRKKARHIRKETGLDKLEREMRADGLPDNMKFVRRPAGESKISAVFLEFLEPFKEYAPTAAAMEKLIVLGIAAWNSTLLSQAKSQELIEMIRQNVLAQTGPEGLADLDHILTTLRKRKARFFADDPRYIVNYRLDSTRDNYHLSIVSTILEPNQEK